MRTRPHRVVRRPAAAGLRYEAKMGEDASRSADFVGSFAKGLRVMRAFGASKPRMTLTEVAEKADLTRAGARRFLHTLVELGYASFDGKHFALTPRVLDLGFAYLSSLGLPEVLNPLLKRVSGQLEESSSASVLDGDDIVYVARVSTQRIMSVRLGIGARLPAVYTSMGRVLLAFASSEHRELCLSALRLTPHTAFTVRTKAKLRRLLNEVRACGYCLVDQELEEGLRSIAVPIFNHQGEIVAAMNVSTQAARVDIDTMKSSYLRVLQEAATDARAALP